MTTRRKARIALALVLLAVLAGCAGFSDGVNQERLAQDASYDWNHSANATYDVQPAEYQAVIDVNNTSEVELWRHGDLGGEEPLQAAAIKFRYPNGTVVGADAFDVERTDSALVVGFPATNGTFAYTAESGSRSVFVPVVGTGSHEVVLPPGMRTSFPVFGDVEPANYQQTRQGERVHVTWESAPENPIYVQYYLERDLYIFGGVVALMAALGVFGIVYFRFQIRRLERRRQDAGLDLEE